MKCFGCGEEGHIEPYCPHAAALDASGKPPWCGGCDERTRLVDSGAGPARCRQCHPNRRKLRHPLRRCPFCHVTVYEWDTGECGGHAGPDVPDRRPERAAIDGLLAAGEQLDGAA